MSNPSTTRRSTTRTGLLGLAVVGVALAGCDSLAETAVEQVAEQAMEADGSEGNVEIDTDTGEFSIDIEGSEGGSLTVGGGEIPDDFPEQFVLPEDGEVRVVTEIPSGVGVQVTSSTTDAFEATKASLAGDGWEQVSESSNSDFSTAIYQKDGLQVTVGALGEDDEYILTYNYMTEPVTQE